MAVNELGINYATALIETLDSDAAVDQVAQDLENFQALIKELPALARVLDYPGMPLDQRTGILGEALDKMSPHPTTRRFLSMVVEKGRVQELASIVEAFQRMRDTRRGVTRAEVVTSVPVGDGERRGWEQALARLTGKKVKIEYRTDHKLLGGALARVGSTVYDGSVRKQLARIRGVLLGE